MPTHTHTPGVASIITNSHNWKPSIPLSSRPPRRHSRPYSPSRVHTESAPYIVSGPTRMPVSRSPSPSRVIRIPTTNHTQLHGGAAQSPTSQATAAAFHERFVDAQQERAREFELAERNREHRFQEAESAREEGESERNKIFEEKAQDYSKQWDAMEESHKDQFRSREASREEGDSRRDEVFTAAQQHRSQVFDLSLLETDKQEEEEDSLEEQLLDQMKSVTAALNRKQVAQLEAAREGHSTSFDEAQRRRNAEIGTHAMMAHPISPSHYRVPSTNSSTSHSAESPVMMQGPTPTWEPSSRYNAQRPIIVQQHSVSRYHSPISC